MPMLMDVTRKVNREMMNLPGKSYDWILPTTNGDKHANNSTNNRDTKTTRTTFSTYAFWFTWECLRVTIIVGIALRRRRHRQQEWTVSGGRHNVNDLWQTAEEGDSVPRETMVESMGARGHRLDGERSVSARRSCTRSLRNVTTNARSPGAVLASCCSGLHATSTVSTSTTEPVGLGLDLLRRFSSAARYNDTKAPRS